MEEEIDIEFFEKTRFQMEHILNQIETMKYEDIMPMLYASMIVAGILGYEIDLMYEEAKMAVSRLKPLFDETLDDDSVDEGKQNNE
jgi:hypothetical protein